MCHRSCTLLFLGINHSSTTIWWVYELHRTVCILPCNSIHIFAILNLNFKICICSSQLNVVVVIKSWNVPATYCIMLVVKQVPTFWYVPQCQDQWSGLSLLMEFVIYMFSVVTASSGTGGQIQQMAQLISSKFGLCVDHFMHHQSRVWSDIACMCILLAGT